MANAKKCDRCGRLYNNKSLSPIKLYRFYESVDLCEFCYSELDTWYINQDACVSLPLGKVKFSNTDEGDCNNATHH